MKTIFVIVAIISAASAASVSRIVGGQNAEDGQFPYEVSLRLFGQHLCGATIINDQWVLTAGHCVAGYPPSQMTVVTGTTSLTQGGETIRVFKTFYHEDYEINDDTVINDVAVIKLLTKIEFNDKVQPIPLNKAPIPSGSDLVVSGWGSESYPSNTVSNVLKYLNQKALGTEECQESFKELGYELTDENLCAFAKDGEGACVGDSGSPLVYNGTVAGIASWVEPCGIGYPDVYTNVSKYSGWIELTIWFES